MEQKKPTKGQLEKMLKEASVYVSKANKKVHFSDIGVTIYDCPEEIVLMSNFHTQIWEKINAKGYSETCIMFSQLIDITLNHMSEIIHKGKNGIVYYTLDDLRSLKNITYPEFFIIRSCEKFIFTTESFAFSLGTEEKSVLKVDSFYKISQIFHNEIGDIAMSGEDKSSNDFWKDFIRDLRLNNLFIDIKEDTVKDIIDFVKSTEDKAYEDIKSFIESKGGEMINSIAIHKSEGDEAEALSELKS